MSPARVVTGLLLAAAVACGGRERGAVLGPVLRDAWSRPAEQGTTGVAYLTLENADTMDLHLTRVTTTAARGAQLHESTTQGNVTTMTPRPDVAIVRGATVAMRPGGLHIMLVDLVKSLAVGDSVPLTLEFANGRRAETHAIVRAP